MSDGISGALPLFLTLAEILQNAFRQERMEDLQTAAQLCYIDVERIRKTGSKEPLQ